MSNEHLQERIRALESELDELRPFRHEVARLKRKLVALENRLASRDQEIQGLQEAFLDSEHPYVGNSRGQCSNCGDQNLVRDDVKCTAERGNLVKKNSAADEAKIAKVVVDKKSNEGLSVCSSTSRDSILLTHICRENKEFTFAANGGRS
jgi:hypothetical protein